MNKKFFSDLSANTLQVLVNQFLGVFIFLLVSRYLNKPLFGELSWSLAVMTFMTTILSLRLEQIVVRNVAAGDDPSKMLTLFAMHNGLTGLVSFAVLSVLLFCWPAFFLRHSLFWVLSISQLLLFFSMPFRQLLTGRSSFIWLAILGSVSNLIRAVWLFLLVILSRLTIEWVLIVFTVSAFVELGMGFWIVCRRLGVPVSGKWRFPDYALLIRASIPQIGMVFLNAGIARADMILMGILSTPAGTAEYGFAYRAYEFSPLPLLVLGPFILNRLARMAGKGAAAAGFSPMALDLLVRGEMVLSTLLPMLFVIAWAPAMDLLTQGKYGTSNSAIFLILSCCLPFQYLVNLFWSQEFAYNRLSLIFKHTAIMAIIVLAGDLVLIPLYGGTGAAFAFLAGMIVQFILYHRTSVFEQKRVWIRYLLVSMGIAVGSGLPAMLLTESTALRLVIAGGIYCLLSFPAGMVRSMDLLPMRKWITKLSKAPLAAKIVDYIRGVNWSLLLFLLLFLNVKLYVKLAAVLLGLFLHRRHPFPRRSYLRKWMGFYLAMIVLALVNFLLTPAGLTLPGMLAFALGIGWWFLALMAAWFIHLFVQEGDPDVLHRTAGLFFLLNAVVMIFVFARICLAAGTINPYTYLGEHQKYYISTGDLITGVSLDGSVTAALISVFGLFYFLYRGRNLFSFFCFVPVLLAGSNFIDLLLVVVFFVVFLFHTGRLQKGMIVLYLFCMLFFVIKVSPQNGAYALRLLERVRGQHAYEVPLSLPKPRPTDFVEDRKDELRRAALGDLLGNFYTAGARDSLTVRYKGWDLSGRWIAWQELGVFFRDHPGKILSGAGMGHFSSRLAFKTAALGIDGNYPVQARYVHPFFLDSYLFIYLYYHSRDPGQHSLINGVDSVYGQLLSEYGLIGAGCFVFFYASFFLRPIRKLSYGIPVVIVLGIAGLTGYWFEQLSVVVLFEFIMLLDMRNIFENA